MSIKIDINVYNFFFTILKNRGLIFKNVLRHPNLYTGLVSIFVVKLEPYWLKNRQEK